MKKTTLAAILAALALVSVASAQDTYSNGTINSGPWKLRRSTGDKTADRTWFIMDRTLNSCEQECLRQMFSDMLGNTSYVVEKAICNAIDGYSKDNAMYNSVTVADWASDNGMSDYQVYHSMESGLRPEERLVLGRWLDGATTTQMMAVGKLVRCGGWANSMWSTSGMNTE